MVNLSNYILDVHKRPNYQVPVDIIKCNLSRKNVINYDLLIHKQDDTPMIRYGFIDKFYIHIDKDIYMILYILKLCIQQ